MDTRTQTPYIENIFAEVSPDDPLMAEVEAFRRWLVALGYKPDALPRDQLIALHDEWSNLRGEI